MHTRAERTQRPLHQKKSKEKDSEASWRDTEGQIGANMNACNVQRNGARGRPMISIAIDPAECRSFHRCTLMCFEYVRTLSQEGPS